MADPFQGRDAGRRDPAMAWVAITPSANELNPRPKFIIASAAGTMTCSGSNGVSAALPVIAGVNWISPKIITAATVSIFGCI